MPQEITERHVDAIAEQEGWGIFGAPGEEHIQTIDEGPSEGPNEGVKQFESDHAALMHVVAKAAGGSVVHKKALELINYQPDPADLPLYQLEVIETIQRTRIYVVEASSEAEAQEKCRMGLTVEEQGDDLQILGRKITSGPTLLTHQG